jgi:quercetin dioxygenase-like cupin family protein
MGEMEQACAILRKNEATTIEFPWGQLTWNANAELGNSADMTVGECVLKPGCENPRHSHGNCAEVLVVKEGEIAHSIGDETVRMVAGDTISIPTCIMHNARNTGDGPAVLFICFSSATRETEGE